MAVELRSPFSWKTVGGDTAAMLAELQPNILKGHARDHLTLLFLRFDETAAARSFARALAVAAAGRPLMKSARTHLEEIAAFKANGTPGTAYVGFGLTAAGYEALGVAPGKRPRDPSFRRGMQQAPLGDPPPSRWEAHLRGGLHAVVIVADAVEASRDRALARVRALLRARPQIAVVGEECGRGMRNANGDCIEHFGFVDGRSQPLFLKEDVSEEIGRSDGATAWNPGVGAGRAIVPDRAAPLPRLHFGSYLVFRKLEQNVRLFMREKAALAARLRLLPGDAARAGAMIIGRFEDGTPLVLQRAAGMSRPVPNDFTYDNDPDGTKCPLFAHIRKVNPRGSGSFSEARERRHLMVRRAQTYGLRTDDVHDGRLATKPTGGVGLLFMAFNASIGEQFEFVQQAWINNPWFPVVGPEDRSPGVDLLAGQGPRARITCPLTWGTGQDHPTATAAVSPPAQVVSMKGGEYFFMPSLAFLRNV
jgi:deferrochelatase/peroxidase EfeB